MSPSEQQVSGSIMEEILRPSLGTDAVTPTCHIISRYLRKLPSANKIQLCLVAIKKKQKTKKTETDLKACTQLCSHYIDTNMSTSPVTG